MTTKPFQSLELISNSPPPQPPRHPGERRRLPRLNLTAEQFRLSLNGKIFSVTDLSSDGLALRILEQADFLLFPVATVFEGTINLKGEKYDIRAKVRHIAPESVGCQFESISEITRNALTRFLDPVALGRELRPIPSSESGTLWYHGPSGTDLLLKRGTDGQYHRMTLYVQGNFMQWSEEQGLITGRACPSDEQGETRGILRIETLWLVSDSDKDRDKLAVAKTLILSSNLSEDLKKWCVRKLEG
ncbi:PilZ domain-containing protein [Bdellovibrionota bacterium FG-1]